MSYCTSNVWHFQRIYFSKIPWRIQNGAYLALWSVTNLHLNIILSSSACHPVPLWSGSCLCSQLQLLPLAPELHSIKAEFVSQDMVPLWTFVLTHIPSSAWNTHQANPEALWTLPPHFQRPTLMPPPVWVITLGHLLQWCWFVSLPVSNCYMGVSRLSKTHCCSSSISSVSTHSRYLGIFDEISEIKYLIYIKCSEDSYYSSNKIIVTLSISDWEEYKASFSIIFPCCVLHVRNSQVILTKTLATKILYILKKHKSISLR